MSGMNYDDYLKVGDLLKLQRPRSKEIGRDAHDEMLFIIVHQAYELWFKQILTELDSVLNLFSKEKIDERWMEMIHSRLSRICEIQKLLVDQVKVLETMTPLDFLDFRDLLIPASGFQSFQFRLIEMKLGLKREDRLKYNSQDFDKSLKAEQADSVRLIETQPSLFALVERWLERTPFLEMKGFDFWKEYRNSVEKTLQDDLQTIHQNVELAPEFKARNIQMLEMSLQSFRQLFDEKVLPGNPQSRRLAFVLSRDSRGFIDSALSRSAGPPTSLSRADGAPRYGRMADDVATAACADGAPNARLARRHRRLERLSVSESDDG